MSQESNASAVALNAGINGAAMGAGLAAGPAALPPLAIAGLGLQGLGSVASIYQAYKQDKAQQAALEEQKRQYEDQKKRQAAQDRLAMRDYLAGVISNGKRNNRDWLEFFSGQYRAGDAGGAGGNGNG
jgi:hypothetical protein